MATTVMAVTMVTFCITVFYLSSRMAALPVHPHGFSRGVVPVARPNTPESTVSAHDTNTITTFSEVADGQFFGFIDMEDCESVAETFTDGGIICARMNTTEGNVPASFVVFGVDKASDSLVCRAFPVSVVGYRDPSVEIVAPGNLVALSRAVKIMLSTQNTTSPVSEKERVNVATLETLLFFAEETMSAPA